MSDEKFIGELDRGDESDREAFLLVLKQKTAAPAFLTQAASATAKFVKNHPYEIAGALLGAAAMVGGQYGTNVRGKSGTSAQQDAARAALGAVDKSIAKDKANRKEPGFSKEMTRSGLVGAKDMADVMAKYPVRGALTVAVPGASLGLAAAKLLKSQLF